MKNQTCHPIFYILLQVLGIWVDGMLGIGFEWLAVLIFSFGKKRSLENLILQGAWVVMIEILIDLFCGDAEMIFEIGVWILGEIKRLVFSWSYIFWGVFIVLFFIKTVNVFFIRFYKTSIINIIISLFDIYSSLTTFINCSENKIQSKT